MSESSFVKEESISSQGTALELVTRLLFSLSLWKKFLPLSLLTIGLSSIAPSFFRWYAGKLSHPDSIRPEWMPFGFSVEGLLWIAFWACTLRIMAWAFFEISGMWAAQDIHAEMVKGLSRTRTTYFDENPSGRLINRFVRDFEELRGVAIIFVGDILNAGAEIITVIAIAAIASPWTVLLSVPLLAVFFHVQQHRFAMMSHARSLSAVATSKVIDRKTDLIEGREVFLLYGKAERLLQRLTVSFRDYVMASALTAQIEAFAGFWIRISVEAFSLVVMLFIAYGLHSGRVDSVFAGVVISSLLGVSGSMSWLDFASSLVARSVPNVRRVFEIVDLPKEENEESSVGRVPASALAPPEAGDLSLIEFTMSYRKDTPVILQSMNLEIPYGTKVALIGRTGAGKTSLMQSLLRMVYVRSGEIRMNGASIYDWPVSEIRKLFGVVPQSPYLFAGDVRANLDRFASVDVQDLESALEAVGLKYSLTHPIEEGGTNLSMGERQLLCLARVIAAKKPYILMDEPTSGLDAENDVRVNRALRTALVGKTVFTIAHRRESLWQYDRVLELSAGRIVRNGTPSDILLAKSSPLTNEDLV